MPPLTMQSRPRLNERTYDSQNEAPTVIQTPEGCRAAGSTSVPVRIELHVDEHLRDRVGLLDEPPEALGCVVERDDVDPVERQRRLRQQLERGDEVGARV